MSIYVRLAALLVALLSCSVCTAQFVKYDVRFDATWSTETHPGAYPSGAHFSPLWIVAHNENVGFWEIGGIASDGIEQMAETGGTSLLTAVYNDAASAGDAGTLLIRPGINSPGDVAGRILVRPSHSLISVVTMVAPSPDWFVGVDSLNLWDTDHWIESVSVDLYAYDAGTDSGTSFQAPNADTNPPEPIALLGAPFTGTPRMGTLTFTFIEPLPGDTNGDDKVDLTDFGIVRNSFGRMGSADGSVFGDTYPYDGNVDIVDFNAVRNNFGLMRRAVPEPSAGVSALFSACIAVLAGQRRRGRISKLTPYSRSRIAQD